METFFWKMAIRFRAAFAIFAILAAVSSQAQAQCLAGDASGPSISAIVLREAKTLKSFADGIVSGRVRADYGGSDPSGMHHVKWYLDGALVKDFTYTLHSQDSYVVFNSGRLFDGKHQISVEVIDTCGNSSRLDKDFEVDNSR